MVALVDRNLESNYTVFYNMTLFDRFHRPFFVNGKKVMLPRIAVSNADIIRIWALVKSGEADMAVTGHFDTGLTATPIAWDGIAVVVDFTNPVKSGDEARRRRHLYAHCNPVGTAGRA